MLPENLTMYTTSHFTLPTPNADSKPGGWGGNVTFGPQAWCWSTLFWFSIFKFTAEKKMMDRNLGLAWAL